MSEELPVRTTNLAGDSNAEAEVPENEDLPTPKDDADEIQECDGGDSGGAEEEEEDDEDDDNPYSSDDEEDAALDALLDAVIDEMADARVKALSEVNISEFPALLATIEAELKKPFTPPIPTEAEAEAALEAEGEPNRGSAFDNVRTRHSIPLTVSLTQL